MAKKIITAYALKEGNKIEWDTIRRFKKDIKEELSLYQEGAIKAGWMKVVKLKIVECKTARKIKL